MAEPKNKAAKPAAASEANDPPPPAKGKTVPGIRVSAKAEGFRRAGRAWTKQPTDVPVSEFSKDQLKALRAETMLTVADIEINAE